MFSEL